MIDRNPCRGTVALYRTGLALVLMVFLLVPACGGPAKGPERALPAGGWRTFEGTGTATGHAQTLQLGPDRRVAIFNLTGSLLTTGDQGISRGFRSESIGVADSLKGSVGWNVWTDSNGDKVFGEIRGGAIGTGNRFTGTFLGGTGPYAGATGDFTFEWQYVVSAEDGSIQGRISGLKGRVRVAAPLPSPRRNGSRGEEGPGLGRD